MATSLDTTEAIFNRSVTEGGRFEQHSRFNSHKYEPMPAHQCEPSHYHYSSGQYPHESSPYGGQGSDQFNHHGQSYPQEPLDFAKHTARGFGEGDANRQSQPHYQLGLSSPDCYSNYSPHQSFNQQKTDVPYFYPRFSPSYPNSSHRYQTQRQYPGCHNSHSKEKQYSDIHNSRSKACHNSHLRERQYSACHDSHSKGLSSPEPSPTSSSEIPPSPSSRSVPDCGLPGPSSPLMGSQKTKNESLAESLGLSRQDVDKIVGAPMDEFSSYGLEYNFTEEQMNILRDIRRRGKNLVAAHNCRKRKINEVEELDVKFKEAKCQSNILKCRHIELENSKKEWQEKLEHVKELVLKGLKLEGDKFSLQIDDDNQVQIVPKEHWRWGNQKHKKEKTTEETA